MTHGERLARLHGLYGIVDDGPGFSAGPVAWAQALVEGGASALQLRFKHTAMGEALILARAVRAACPQALLIVDDRPDLALLCNADGVHVGDQDLTPADCRQLLGAERLVGATARDAAAGQQRLAEGADHLGVGPIFVSSTKAVGHPPLGIAGLRAVRIALPFAPLVAIAGIDVDNIGAVAAAGANAAAVIGAVGRAADPRQAAAALVAAWGQGLA